MMQPFQAWQPQPWPPIQPQPTQPQPFQAFQAQTFQGNPPPNWVEGQMIQIQPLGVLNVMLFIAWCVALVVWANLYTKRARQKSEQNGQG